jgi:hypothetical protein
MIFAPLRLRGLLFYRRDAETQRLFKSGIPGFCNSKYLFILNLYINSKLKIYNSKLSHVNFNRFRPRMLPSIRSRAMGRQDHHLGKKKFI